MLRSTTFEIRLDSGEMVVVGVDVEFDPLRGYVAKKIEVLNSTTRLSPDEYKDAELRMINICEEHDAEWGLYDDPEFQDDGDYDEY